MSIGLLISQEYFHSCAEIVEAAIRGMGYGVRSGKPGQKLFQASAFRRDFRTMTAFIHLTFNNTTNLERRILPPNPCIDLVLICTASHEIYS